MTFIPNLSNLSNLKRNPYTAFREVGDYSSIDWFNNTSIRPLTRALDEPTYLSFKLEFGHRHVDNALDNTDFDRIPQPLFSPYTQDDISARNYYSTYQYLRDSNEPLRAIMLTEFITKWKQLQEGYQWYFQEIAGLNTLMNILPGRGRRVGADARLTLTMLEGLDQRVTHLLNLYRKVAWDDNYQRWILPDIMRYFRITLYITEFRSFHRSNYPGNLVQNQISGETRSLNPDVDTPLILTLMKGLVPTYIIDMERCEFDLETFNVLPDTINIGEAEMRQLTFGIKVGNFKERYVNPVFNSFWYDILINGYGRTAQTGETVILSQSNQEANLLAEGTKAQENLLTTESHESARPFVQTGITDNIRNSSPNYRLDVEAVNPTDPATWVGNTINLGKALVTNLVKGKVDELKVSKIPGLGVSFNEAIAAIQSKNVFTLFGAARRAISDTVSSTLPSQELEGNLVDTQFRDFLTGISQSEATSDEAIALQEAANMVLNDQGQWEKIRDLSMATDLISTALGEINTPNNIENASALKNSYLGEYVPLDIKDLLVFEGVPSSIATQGRDLEGQNIQQPLPGVATDGQTELPAGISAELGSTDGVLPGGSTLPPSSELGDSAGESLPMGESGLGEIAEGNMTTANPSEQLGKSLTGEIETGVAGEELGTNAVGSQKTGIASEQLGDSINSDMSTTAPSEQLGVTADGDLHTARPSERLDGDAAGGLSEVQPSQQLGADAVGGIDQPGLADETITGESLNLPEPGKAVDDSGIDATTLPQPNPSRATENGNKISG